MAQAGGTAASTNYTISPQDLQYLQAMLTHEGQSTILNDLSKGNTNSAYGQLSGLVETWLNRAMSTGTSLPTQMLAPGQLSYFDAANVPNEAATLDPRINTMLGAYLQSRSTGDAAVFPNVNQYLNKELTDATYSQAYHGWYDKSSLIGAFGDPRSGGRSSLQQEFLSNPDWGGIPDYSVSLAPGVQLNPSEGDINALADFRGSVQPYTPFPPARPMDGSAGIDPRAEGQGNVGGPLDQFSNAITGGLQSAGNAVGGALTGFGNALSTGLGNVFGAVPQTPQTIGPFGAINTPPPISFPAGFGENPTLNGVSLGNLFQPNLPQAAPGFGAPDMPGVDTSGLFNPSGFLGAGNGSIGGFGSVPQFGRGAAFPQAPSFNGAIQQPNPLAGNFGIPQAQGVIIPPLFGGQNPITGDFDIPQAQGVDPGTPFGNVPQFSGNFNLPMLSPFGGRFGMPATNVNTLGPDQPAHTLGPDASADPFGFSGASVSPLGFGGSQATPFGGGFGGFNARTLGFGGGNVPTFGFSGTSAPTLGFNGTDVSTVGPDQFATASGPAAPAPGPFGFGGLNFGAGLGAQPQSFGGLFGTGNAPAAPAYNPFGGGVGGFGGFGSGFDASGGLGATPQSFGGLFGAPAAPAAPAPGPFDFGGANVGAGLGATPQDFGSLYGAPAAPAAPPDAGDGSGFGSTPPDLGFGFDPQASENAFLRGQMANNAAMQQAGQAPQASNPNLYPSLFAAIAPTPTNGTSYIAPQPNHAPAPGFSAPVSYAAPQVSLMMAAPQISLPTMNFSGGGFGGLGGFL